MNYLWISGWAIPPAWLARQAQLAWPDCTHVAVTPSGAARALANETYDALGGYSLGALWLLQHAHRLPAKLPVVLLAPFFAFPAESGGGGRIALAQLRVQRRRLRKDAPASVSDFMRRAGLGDSLIPLVVKELTPKRIDELDTELGWLEDWHAPGPPPAEWYGFVGDQDLLIESAVLQKAWPGLHVTTGIGHAPEALLREAAKRLKSEADGVAAAPPGRHNRFDDADVIGGFDRAADAYDMHSAPQTALAAALAQWIGPEERHGRAIEFGAGTGAFTRCMLPWDGSYLATDAAPRMVALGRERCPGADWKAARADAADIGPADWLFSCNVLHWMSDPAAMLRHWRALLVPGGHLALTVFLSGTLGELQALLPEASALRWRTQREWETRFTQAGFAIERMEVWEHTAIYPSALALLRALHAMGLAPRRLVGAGRLRAALREYDRRFATPGGVHATWQGWRVRGVAV